MPSAAWEWGLWGPFQSQHSGILWFCDLHSPFQPNHSMNIVILDNIYVCCSTDAHIRNQAANSSTIYLPSQTASSPELLSSIPTNSAVPQLGPRSAENPGTGTRCPHSWQPHCPQPHHRGRQGAEQCLQCAVHSRKPISVAGRKLLHFRQAAQRAAHAWSAHGHRSDLGPVLSPSLLLEVTQYDLTSSRTFCKLLWALRVRLDAHRAC